MILTVKIALRQVEKLLTMNTENNEVGRFLGKHVITVILGVSSFAIVNFDQSP